MCCYIQFRSVYLWQWILTHSLPLRELFCGNFGMRGEGVVLALSVVFFVGKHVSNTMDKSSVVNPELFIPDPASTFLRSGSDPNYFFVLLEIYKEEKANQIVSL